MTSTAIVSADLVLQALTRREIDRRARIDKERKEMVDDYLERWKPKTFLRRLLSPLTPPDVKPSPEQVVAILLRRTDEGWGDVPYNRPLYRGGDNHARAEKLRTLAIAALSSDRGISALMKLSVAECDILRDYLPVEGFSFQDILYDAFACHRAFNNRYHKVAAATGFDEFSGIWRAALASLERGESS